MPEGYEVEFRRGLHANLLRPARGKERMHPDGRPVTVEEMQNKEERNGVRRKNEQGEEEFMMRECHKNGYFLEDRTSGDPRETTWRETAVEDDARGMDDEEDAEEDGKEGSHGLVTRARMRRETAPKRRLEEELNEEADRKRRRCHK